MGYSNILKLKMHHFWASYHSCRVLFMITQSITLPCKKSDLFLKFILQTTFRLGLGTNITFFFPPLFDLPGLPFS